MGVPSSPSAFTPGRAFSEAAEGAGRDAHGSNVEEGSPVTARATLGLLLAMLIVAIAAWFRRPASGAASPPSSVPLRSPAESLLAARLARGKSTKTNTAPVATCSATSAHAARNRLARTTTRGHAHDQGHQQPNRDDTSEALAMHNALLEPPRRSRLRPPDGVMTFAHEGKHIRWMPRNGKERRPMHYASCRLASSSH